MRIKTTNNIEIKRQQKISTKKYISDKRQCTMGPKNAVNEVPKNIQKKRQKP